MAIGLIGLLLLIGLLRIVRHGGPASPLAAWQSRPSTKTVLAGVALALLANAPLALLVPGIGGLAAILPGDARTHALVAEEIARGGIPHGWIGAYQGGFPFGPHYPSVGWLLAASLIRFGVSAPFSLHAMALLAIVGVPVAVFVLAVHRGARPYAALLGAFIVSWVAPTNAFTGGYEPFYAQGLFSQVLGVVPLVFLAAGLATNGSPWRVTVPAALAVLTHPQLATSFSAVALLPVMVTLDRRAFVRYVRAVAVIGVLGAAVYGPGIATLRIPFGWPPAMSWRVTGFGPERLAWWFVDGDLLDFKRVPVLTTLWGGALLIVLARLQRPAARAVLCASFMAVALSVSGGTLLKMGPVGAFLVEFLQPLRVLGLIPLVAAATVLVAGEEIAPFALHIGSRLVEGRPRSVAVAGVLSVLVMAACALPARFGWALASRRELLARPPGTGCGPVQAGGGDAPNVAAWVRELRGGRLWYDDDTDAARECAVRDAFELTSSIPIAVTSAVGAHVGVHSAAFHELHPDRAGSAARAEALGVRDVLFFGAPPEGDGWAVVQKSGTTGLARRRLGTDTVGVGCITSAWEGGDRPLREKLFAELATEAGANRLLDPTTLVELKETSGAVTERQTAPEGCDAHGAQVREENREPGAFEAEVTTAAPVDVVFRAAAFPSWQVRVDDAFTPATRVAPGFFTVRVGPGRHHVVATVSPLPHYTAGVVFALGVALMLSWSSVTLRFRRSSGRTSPPRSIETVRT